MSQRKEQNNTSEKEPNKIETRRCRVQNAFKRMLNELRRIEKLSENLKKIENIKI